MALELACLSGISLLALGICVGQFTRFFAVCGWAVDGTDSLVVITRKVCVLELRSVDGICTVQVLG